MEIRLTVDKGAVMREVAVTTAYTGGKMEGDENAFNRISTVDEDEKHLERFWEESRTDLCQELIGLVKYEGMSNGPVEPDVPFTPKDDRGPVAESMRPRYELLLEVSRSFDTALLASMQLSLFSYFVHNIAAKWYIYTNKGEAGEYADKAATLLDDIHRKAVYKKRPVRPTYDD